MTTRVLSTLFILRRRGYSACRHNPPTCSLNDIDGFFEQSPAPEKSDLIDESINQPLTALPQESLWSPWRLFSLSPPMPPSFPKSRDYDCGVNESHELTETCLYLEQTAKNDNFFLLQHPTHSPQSRRMGKSSEILADDLSIIVKNHFAISFLDMFLTR